MPVEVCALDGQQGSAISAYSHAVMRDVSAGGGRFEVLKSAVGALGGFQAGVGHLQMRFITPELADRDPIGCRIRWSRPMTGGASWTVGVEFGDEGGVAYPWLVGALHRYRARSPVWRAARHALLAAMFVALMVPAAYGARGLFAVGAGDGARQALEALEHQLTEARRETEMLSSRLNRSKAETNALRQRLDVCSRDLNQPTIELNVPAESARRAAADAEAEASAESTDVNSEHDRASHRRHEIDGGPGGKGMTR